MPYLYPTSPTHLCTAFPVFLHRARIFPCEALFSNGVQKTVTTYGLARRATEGQRALAIPASPLRMTIEPNPEPRSCSAMRALTPQPHESHKGFWRQVFGARLLETGLSWLVHGDSKRLRRPESIPYCPSESTGIRCSHCSHLIDVFFLSSFPSPSHIHFVGFFGKVP